MSKGPSFAESHIVKVLGCVLEQVVNRNDKIPVQPEHMTIFHAYKPPAISAQDYLTRVNKYVNCSNECYVMALIYLDRLIQLNPNFMISSMNVHRLLITSIMLAAKFFDDVYYNNNFYARVGGVPLTELNALEIEFLFLVNFSLHIETDEYEKYRKQLTAHSDHITAKSESATNVVEIRSEIITP
eukprot:c12681_g1_i1.p1 GENE.c12681_g1_i1~~c12681_g1_i1.p1  ORF type:complete len:185 (-),score=32.75 c12681_g1_i1:41-595(-)